MMWYYGLDASSGCIWDLSAISNIELLNPPTNTKETTHENTYT